MIFQHSFQEARPSRMIYEDNFVIENDLLTVSDADDNRSTYASIYSYNSLLPGSRIEVTCEVKLISGTQARVAIDIGVGENLSGKEVANFASVTELNEWRTLKVTAFVKPDKSFYRCTFGFWGGAKGVACFRKPRIEVFDSSINQVRPDSSFTRNVVGNFDKDNTDKLFEGGGEEIDNGDYTRIICPESDNSDTTRAYWRTPEIYIPQIQYLIASLNAKVVSGLPIVVVDAFHSDENSYVAHNKYFLERKNSKQTLVIPLKNSETIQRIRVVVGFTKSTHGVLDISKFSLTAVSDLGVNELVIGMLKFNEYWTIDKNFKHTFNNVEIVIDENTRGKEELLIHYPKRTRRPIVHAIFDAYSSGSNLESKVHHATWSKCYIRIFTHTSEGLEQINASEMTKDTFINVLGL